MKPGIYPNIPFREYLKIEAVSNSYLGRLDECPAKGLIPRKDTGALGLGRAIHTVVLEGIDAFDEQYAIAPEVDKRTKAGKLAWAGFQEANKDKDIIKPDDAEKAFAIRKAVFSHPAASKLLAEGVQEQTLVWYDKETGLLCKARPDFVPGKKTCTLIDLKSTRNASERGFLRAIADYGYARQGSFYTDGYGATTQVYIDACVLIAVESEAPYRTECYLLDEEFLTWGRSEYRRLLRIEQQCRKTGVYPHYKSASLVQIFKPGWMI